MPLSDTISYVDLAAAAHVPEQRLKSIIRMAIINTLFLKQQDRKRVGHSATSALLARNSNVYAYATYMCAKSAPTAMHMTAAHQRWGPASMLTNEMTYNIAFNTDLPFFGDISKDDAKMGEFARYMRNVRSSESVDLKRLVASFTWQDIHDGGVIVDVSPPSGSETSGEKIC